MRGPQGCPISWLCPVCCWLEPVLVQGWSGLGVDELVANIPMDTCTVQKMAVWRKRITHSTLHLCKSLGKKKRHVILPNGELWCFSLGYMVPPKNLWLLNALMLPTGTQWHNTKHTVMSSSASVLCTWFTSVSPPSSQSPAQVTWHTVMLGGPSSSSCIALFSISLFLTSWNEYFPRVDIFVLKAQLFSNFLHTWIKEVCGLNYFNSQSLKQHQAAIPKKLVGSCVSFSVIHLFILMNENKLLQINGLWVSTGQNTSQCWWGNE